MLDSFAHREGTDAWETDPNVKLRASIILHWMRIYAVGFETTCDKNELVVDRNKVQARLTFSVQLDDFLF